MKKLIVTALLSLTLVLSACSNIEKAGAQQKDTDKIDIVATTTMLADLAKTIGGERANVKGLMGPGIDPHLYQASAGDVDLMQNAEIIIYNGLHLEGKMGEVFENLSGSGKTIICIEDGLDKSKLLQSEDDASAYDPHIWFDVSLWKDAAKFVEQKLSEADAQGKEYYSKNLDEYIKVLDETNEYIKNRINEIPKAQRVLVTAHDAFGYYGNAYGLQVKGLQGISTDAEAGTADVSDLAEFIATNKIKAIFIESSIPPKTIEALQAAVKAKGFDVSIGGELYSDSLGGEGTKDESYVNAIKTNTDTIADALK